MAAPLQPYRTPPPSPKRGGSPAPPTPDLERRGARLPCSTSLCGAQLTPPDKSPAGVHAIEVVPTKLLKRLKSMNETGLTLQNISSRLQKYRLSLKRQTSHVDQSTSTDSTTASSIQTKQTPALLQQIIHPRALHTQLAPDVHQVITTNLPQQHIQHYQPNQILSQLYNMHHQQVERLSEPHSNEPIYKEYNNLAQRFTQVNYHGHSSIHDHHYANIIKKLLPPNVMQPCDLINALPQQPAAATACCMQSNTQTVSSALLVKGMQNHPPDHHIQAFGVLDMGTAQYMGQQLNMYTAEGNWRGTTPQNMHPISQVHRHVSEPPPSYFSNNAKANGRSQEDLDVVLQQKLVINDSLVRIIPF
ncbi:hypothetical protein OsJ_11288 [Oryza sativa Japonica Group]|uniref:Uncharacterized protein n=1 Tax=Oryza sativa subsp. japonica TaxID=39947 RepID=B9F918_ORYSJ|nr:hypothetical protein OsJ_11288 [Oryza sativa Japonica Group]